MSQSIHKNPNWTTLYKLGGAAAIGAVVVGIIEIFIQIYPGSNPSQETVLGWFLLFQENPFMGLRNLGLLNIFLNILAIFTYLALYGTHHETLYQPQAALAAIISFLGIGVFFATNRAFAMWGLSQQYAAEASDLQRAALAAAGQAMLSVGGSHSPGTFLAFFLLESAGIWISFVMLRAQVFSKITAFAGMLGFGLLLAFEFISSFITGLDQATMLLAMLSGLLTMVWYILIARRLFQMSAID